MLLNTEAHIAVECLKQSAALARRMARALAAMLWISINQSRVQNLPSPLVCLYVLVLPTVMGEILFNIDFRIKELSAETKVKH